MIIPMVVHAKKIGGIHFCVDMHNLNDAYVHDPFPTPFRDEILEKVGGKEVYYFINGVLVYH